MKTGKTPYEIRADLLNLGYSIVLGQKEAKCAKQADETGNRIPLLTDAPTSEEIISEARKLNDFVSQTHER